MVNLEIFLVGLLATSAITSLVTEAIKIVLEEHNKTYRSNTLAGIVAILVSIAIGVCYIVISGASITPQIIVCIFALIVMGWLCAMVGYDKVIQAISQFKTAKKEN